jgi:hypothetical protein
MNLALHPMTTGGWRRSGTIIVLDDPFAPPLPEGEQESSGRPPGRRPKPSDAQLDLLKQFFGSGADGARKRLADFRVPPGLKARTLRWYAALALRALADPRKATPTAEIVQRLRLQLIERALRERR